MENRRPQPPSACRLEEALPEEAVLIVGAGHFGGRAVRLLTEKGYRHLLVVDDNEDKLAEVNPGPSIQKFDCDGIDFLFRNFALLHPRNYIVPAIPVHLAFAWLKRHLQTTRVVLRSEIPETILPKLPHTWEGGEGSLLVSYADFICPDDCPEPADYCTVTGLKRGKPLYRLLADLEVPGHLVHVIRSRQLAPGLGGYRAEDLQGLLSRIREGGQSKWLVGTACRCHGVLSAMEV
jgi:hypothetical protein